MTSQASRAGASDVHKARHRATSEFQVGHAQPYKIVFVCHTDVDIAVIGLPFYTINQGDPTLATRAEGSAPAALMPFTLGNNPLWAGTGYRIKSTYAVLRTVPVALDIFRSHLAGPVAGPIPPLPATPAMPKISPLPTSNVTPRRTS